MSTLAMPIKTSEGDRLRERMDASENLHVREAILMHRLCFDIQLAAANAGIAFVLKIDG
jgi:hypothetical protein